MFTKIAVKTVDARQWLLGVRQAALTIHDDIYRSLKPVLLGQQLSLAGKNQLANVARDIVQQKGASMFVLLSAARIAESGFDGVESDLSELPNIANLDEVLKAIHGYLASTAFLDDISHLLLSPRVQSPDIASTQLSSSFNQCGHALKALLDQVDISLGVSHLDYRNKASLSPNSGLQNRNQVS